MIMISTEKNATKYAKGHSNFKVEYIDAGYHFSEDHWAHKKRFLDHYEIIFVTKGNLYLQVNNKQLHISDNDIVVLPQYVTISSYMASEAPLSFFWVKFHSINFDELQLKKHFFKIPIPFELIKLLKELMQISNSNNYLEYAKDIVLIHLLCYLSANCNHRLQRNSPDIAAVLQWIDENISADLSVERISNTFNYHKDYLCRVFKAEIGSTMKGYINFKQLKKAKDLLLTSEYSIKKISEILKYENPNLFIKFFKYHEKVSPNKFRTARR